MLSSSAKCRSLKNGVEILVRGTVQGVGFRPFVFKLASHYCISGSVTNTSDGVLIQAAAPDERLFAFIEAIEAQALFVSSGELEVSGKFVEARKGYTRVQTAFAKTEWAPKAAERVKAIQERQAKARALAARNGVSIDFRLGDVATWDWQATAF